MPELPEVETLKRELAKKLVGKKIKSIESERFRLDLVGKKIEAVDRRAKILILKLTGEKYLLIHLKMTGQLIYQPKIGPLVIGGHPQDEPFKYTRFTFHFTDGSKLFFNDLRKFGWLRLLGREASQKIFEAHGVEPLTKEFTLEKFKQLLARYPKRKIKPLLLDQTLIGGLGNIYTDEACFLAGIRPTRRVGRLTSLEQKKLHQSIIQVLKLAIAKKGTSARNYRRSDGSRGGFVPYLNVYGRNKEKCKKCATLISKTRQNGRGTHFCSQCQK